LSRIADLAKDYASKYKATIRSADQVPKIKTFPMGLPSFDAILQDCGGIPFGRVAEGHGLEGSGKSTWGHAISAAGTRYDKDFTTLWLDVEGCFDSTWAAKMGQNLENTLLPDDLFWAEDYIARMKWGIVNNINLIVLDSLPALVPKVVGERHVIKTKTGVVKEDQTGAGTEEQQLSMYEKLQRATIFSQVLMPTIMSGFFWEGQNYRLRDCDTFIYFVNQLRDRQASIHVDKITPGGQALKHLYSIRWQFTKLGVSDETNDYGDSFQQVIRITNVKNKVGTPFRRAVYMLNLDGGFSEMDVGLMSIAKRIGVVTGGSSGHYIVNTGEGQTRIHGKDKVIDFLRQHPDLLESVKFKKEDKVEFAYDDKVTTDQAAGVSDKVFDLITQGGLK